MTTLSSHLTDLQRPHEVRNHFAAVPYILFMSLRRTTRRWIALLAVVVVSFSALTPTLANAFATNNTPCDVD